MLVPIVAPLGEQQDDFSIIRLSSQFSIKLASNFSQKVNSFTIHSAQISPMMKRLVNASWNPVDYLAKE